MLPPGSPLARVCINNPANPVALWAGIHRLLTFGGPIVVEAVTQGDAVALRELAKRFPVWIRLLNGLNRGGRVKIGDEK